MPGVSFDPFTVILAGLICQWVWPLALQWSERRVPSFIVDFAIGAAVSSACLVVMSCGDGKFVSVGSQAWTAIGLAAVGGVITMVGTVVVATGMELVGLARAVLVAVSANLVASVALSLVMGSSTQPRFLLAGLALAMVATTAAAGACARGNFRPGMPWRKPVIIAALGGALLAAAPPYVTRALTGPTAVPALIVAASFVAAAALSSPGPIRYLMKRPLVGAVYQPGTLFLGSAIRRLTSGLSGTLWGIGTGAVLSTSSVAIPASAQGAAWLVPMLVAAAGIGIWRELRDADLLARSLLALAIACYLVAVVAIFGTHQAFGR